MKVYLSPQVNQEKIIYEFEDKSFTATVKDVTDTFDFSEFPDGQLDVQSVETSLEINPILSAEIVDGELSVELVNYIGADSPEHERFPEWIDHTDYERAKEKEVNEEQEEIGEIVSDLSNELGEPDKDNEENEANETDNSNNNNDSSEVRNDGKNDMEE